jgi:hypothetical protein
MPYKNIERRRVAGREAQRRYRMRHPERIEAYHRSDKAREARRAYKARNRERVRAADRAAHKRLRERQRTAGMSPALARLHADLAACHDTATRNRLAAAIEHMTKVIAGERVKPRDPNRAELRPTQPIKFNVRPAPATAAADDGSDPVKPTGRTVSSWLDEKLPPETS